MGWTTLLLGGLVTFAVLVGLLFPVVFAVIIANHRLGPPRVRGLSPGEEPRYLGLITEPSRRHLEDLGFRAAGYLATRPIIQVEREILQLVMRNDETRTLAYLYVRNPFSATRPSTVGFESFLPDGSVFGTSARFTRGVGTRLPNRLRSGADDEQGMYRDHVAALVRSGLAAIELPATFEGLVALNVNDAAWIWRTRLEQGVVVTSRAGGFRYTRWAALMSVPTLLSSQLANAVVESRRRRLDQAKAPLVDAGAPEIRQFLDERARRRKEAAEAASSKMNMGRTKTVLLWVTMVISFTAVWQLLNHRGR